jgi:hypothetical protein
MLRLRPTRHRYILWFDPILGGTTDGIAAGPWIASGRAVGTSFLTLFRAQRPCRLAGSRFRSDPSSCSKSVSSWKSL